MWVRWLDCSSRRPTRGVRAYRKEIFTPSVFGHVLNAHQLEPQSAYAVEDSVEV
jgi:hypothetical protein